MVLSLLALATARCGGLANATFADMHDGDEKSVTISDGWLTLSQAAPVAWSVASKLDSTSCVASVDFSRSAKPAKPPVPLDARVLRTSRGGLLLEWTDPSGTLSPNRTYPLNVWTATAEPPATGACATFATTMFQDMHDGDVKSVSVGKDLVLTMGQAGVWNLTTPVDPTTCEATVDFSKSAKPKFPPVPLTASLSRASGKDARSRVVVTFTDPSKTIAPAAGYPLNIWESV